MPRPLEGPAPKLIAPAGAVDCHTHFYLSQYEGQPGGPPPAAEASVADYRRLQKWLGLSRVIVVQPNAYQRDNRCALDCLAQFGDSARGVMAVGPDTPDAELERMTALGVRGARVMNLPGGAVKLGEMLAVNRRVLPFGWSMIVQFDGRDLLGHEAPLRQIEGNYVIDHTGKFLEPVAPDHPAFIGLLRLVDRGNCYVKLAGCYETSRTGGPDYADIGAMAKALAAHAPERLIWGSNWPHVGVSRENYPSDAELLDALGLWIPDNVTQKLILADNPVRLYGFS